MEDSGKINTYTCEKCKRKFITRNADSGCTPFMAMCIAEDCDGHAQSAFYNVPQNLTATYEWYKPSGKELVAMQFSPELLQTIEHVKKGGLLMRKIGGPTWLESWKERHPAKSERKPLEARLVNEDPGPRLLVEGCKHCDHYRIMLWEEAQYEGSCTQLFGDHESADDALAEACFWGNIMGIPVEIELDLVKEVAQGDIPVRGSDGRVHAGPGAKES